MPMKRKRKKERKNVHQPIQPTPPNPPSNSSSLYQSSNSILQPLYLTLHLHLYRRLLWKVVDDLGKLLGVRMGGGSRFGIQTFSVTRLCLTGRNGQHIGLILETVFVMT